MNCPKCGNRLPDDSAFCPYCGNEKLESVKSEEPVEKAVTEDTEETEAETTEETVTEATEGDVEETAAEETVTEEVADAETAAEEIAAEVTGGDVMVEGASGKKIVIAVLAVLVVLAALAAAFVLGKQYGGEPAVTTGDAVVTTGGAETAYTTDATVAENTELFPDEYTVVYPDGFDYTNANIEEFIKLGQYKGLEVTVTAVPEITDEDVEAYIESMRAYYPIETEVTDRAAVDGDSVVIDFIGRVDGVAFDGGTATDFSLTIGAGGFIEGFEDGIIGMMPGDTKMVDTVFPDDYGSAELAGKEAVFEITLNYIVEQELPEYNDTFVRENTEFETTVEFEAYVRDGLNEEREYTVETEKQTATMAAVMTNAEVIAFPEGLVDDYMYQQVSQLRQYASAYGMSYEDMVLQGAGMSAADYENLLRQDVETAVKQELVIWAVSHAEGFTITDEERSLEAANLLEYYGYSDMAEMCAAFGVSEEYFDNTIDFSVIYNKVWDFLIENTTFTIE